MLLTLQIASVMCVALALALAHALELPGKMRLDKATYLAVQRIDYPGFTYGGLGEGLGIVATLALLFASPIGTSTWWWVLIAAGAIVTMHAVCLVWRDGRKRLRRRPGCASCLHQLGAVSSCWW